MARYFFNIYDGQNVFDDTGVELRSAKEIRSHMLSVAKAWIELEEHQKDVWRVEARDEDEKLVGSVHFGVESDDG